MGNTSGTNNDVDEHRDDDDRDERDGQDLTTDDSVPNHVGPYSDAPRLI